MAEDIDKILKQLKAIKKAITPKRPIGLAAARPGVASELGKKRAKLTNADPEKCRERARRSIAAREARGVYVFRGGTPYQAGRPDRACQAKFKDGYVCQRWAMKGKKYCQKHGGKRHGTEDNSGTILKRGRVQVVSKFYSAALGPKLSQFLSTVRPESHKDFVCVKQELEVARLAASAAVTLYSHLDEALERGVGADGEPLAEQDKKMLMVQSMNVGKQVINAMNKVAEIAERAQKLHEQLVASLDAKDVEQLVNQLVRIMYNICGETHKHIAERFHYEVENSVRIPGTVAAAQGTLLSPDKAVEMMVGSMLALPQPDQQQ